MASTVATIVEMKSSLSYFLYILTRLISSIIHKSINMWVNAHNYVNMYVHKYLYIGMSRHGHTHYTCTYAGITLMHTYKYILNSPTSVERI